jgi:hypothetical protein
MRGGKQRRSIFQQTSGFQQPMCQMQPEAAFMTLFYPMKSICLTESVRGMLASLAAPAKRAPVPLHA